LPLSILIFLIFTNNSGIIIDNELHLRTCGVLRNSSQEDTFKIVGIPLIEKALKGVSSTLLTYGGVGSGKTYSLFGGNKNHENGIIMRSLEMLLQNRFYFKSKFL